MPNLLETIRKRLKPSINSVLDREKVEPIVVVKPARVLGGVYIDNKVCQRRPVVLCVGCVRKYHDWYRKEHYRADWGWRYVGNCDGCGLVGCQVTLFLPEERFHECLSPAHGLNPKP